MAINGRSLVFGQHYLDNQELPTFLKAKVSTTVNGITLMLRYSIIVTLIILIFFLLSPNSHANSKKDVPKTEDDCCSEYYSKRILKPVIDRKQGYQKFVLKKGKGIEVCEAYLKRLNATWFDKPPFCDRPDNLAVAGFERLNRVDLTDQEIHDIYYRIKGFFEGDQFKYERKRSDLSSEQKESQIAYVIGTNYESARPYRFHPRLAVDNGYDSVLADNIVMWRENPSRCGTSDSLRGDVIGDTTIAVILTEDLKTVDETQTRRLFGHPIPYPGKKGEAQIEGYRSIGWNMSIFRYKGMIYFDTFLDELGDFGSRRRNDPNIINTLAVFKREKGKTKEICEYLWKVPLLYPDVKK